MSTQAQARRQETEWLLVSERNRCPICGASESCHRDLEGAFVCCTRRTSDWLLTNGAWLHRVESIEGAERDVTGAEVVAMPTRAELHVPRSPMSASTQ
jgi:hypothetical protein